MTTQPTSPNGPTASAIPATMPAAYIEQTGPAEAIIVGELPVPQPGPRQVLVRVAAVSVNPVDTYIRSGSYATALHFPFIIGRDLVGHVVALGKEALGFGAGQAVWTNSLGYDGRQGSAAAYAVVDQDRLYPLPPGVDPLQAVAVIHLATTAYIGLVQRVGGLHPGQTVLVEGGAGNVGSAVVQLARAMGARVVATAHGAEDTAWCREIGAAAVLDYTAPDLTAQLRNASPVGYAVVWNTGGHYDLDRAVGLLARRGCLVFMAGLQARPELPVGPFYTKDARAVGFAITGATLPELSDAAAAIDQLLAAGTIRARIAAVLPLSQAAEAQRMVEQHTVKGRVVLRVDAGAGAGAGAGTGPSGA